MKPTPKVLAIQAAIRERLAKRADKPKALVHKLDMAKPLPVANEDYWHARPWLMACGAVAAWEAGAASQPSRDIREMHAEHMREWVFKGKVRPCLDISKECACGEKHPFFDLAEQREFDK